MGILICLATLWILWLISPKRRRRLVIQPLAVVVVGLVVLTSTSLVTLLNAGLTAALPPDSGETADAIVVLGRGPSARESRLAAVWELWSKQRAPRIFISGMSDARPMAKALKEEGVPIEQVSGEDCSQTTEENALFTAAVLRPQGIQTILLVTDTAHMWRSHLVFQRMGFNVLPYPISSKHQRLTLTLREYAALVAYAFNGRFQARSPAELDNPPQFVQDRLVDWNCVETVQKTLRRQQ